MPLDENLILNRFKRIDDLDAKVTKLQEISQRLDRLGELEIELKKAGLEIEGHRREAARQLLANREKDGEIERLKVELTGLHNRNIQLAGEIDRFVKLRPAMKVEDLTRHLKKVVADANKEAASSTGQNVAVEQMEVEFKGGVELKDGVQLTQISGEPTAQTVSTIKFSLRPVASFRVSE